MSDTQIAATLTPAEIQTAQALTDGISANVTSAVPPNTFVYWVGFDGTRNDVKDPALSGDMQSTAIGALRDQILKAKAANVEVGYFLLPCMNFGVPPVLHLAGNLSGNRKLSLREGMRQTYRPPAGSKTIPAA